MMMCDRFELMSIFENQMQQFHESQVKQTIIKRMLNCVDYAV